MQTELSPLQIQSIQYIIRFAGSLYKCDSNRICKAMISYGNLNRCQYAGIKTLVVNDELCIEMREIKIPNGNDNEYLPSQMIFHPSPPKKIKNGSSYKSHSDTKC